ncbi:polyisoprenyl-teichoic acid--peptidoglycan teichoic acid transferase TagU [Rossellomorea aquimaris]|uniref:polyisoprenyl-teichoic acid--peptidoglycan teichoic acid transferase TagU n=1 Tax=Rossellomorea aquimaris TaxID=189382 RepID=UPI0005CA02BD|nr:LytR family transcriptional regulator [Rossellomorea aquimaris]
MRADKHNKKRKWPKVVAIGLILLLVAGGGYAYSIYHSLNKTAETMNEKIDRPKSEKRTEEVKFEKKHPFSVLLLGVDERDGDRGRSDSMIVVTVNPHEKTTKMMSIPRDTRVEIVGKGMDDKINHAYAFGGVEMTMDTVEEFLDIPIDYYAKINMEGFRDIVDAVGGVTVQNDFTFNYEGYTFKEGSLTLSGKEALAYSRMRYEDPRGDFGRQARQRQVIQAVIKEGASVSSLWNYGDIFGAIGENVKTNLTLEEMVDIQKNYKSATKDISQSQIAGEGAKLGGIYYYIVPEEEKQKVQSDLKDHLDLN